MDGDRGPTGEGEGDQGGDWQRGWRSVVRERRSGITPTEKESGDGTGEGEGDW